MATDDEGTTCNGLLRLLHRYTQQLPHRFPISGSSKNHPHIISLGLRIKEITIAHLQHILCPAGKDQPACVSFFLFRESFRHPPQTSSSTGKSLFRPLPSDCAPTPYSGSISGKRQAGKEPESSPTCIPRGTMSHSSLCRSATIYKAITPPLSERRAEAGPRHICPASNAALYSKKGNSAGSK